MLKKAQLAIQYIFAFVLFLIMITSSLFFINNYMEKLISYLKERANIMDLFFIRNVVFGFSGNPPYWNNTLENVSIVGYSVKPFVLDFDRLTFNDLIMRNLSSYDEFYDMFSKYVTEPGAFTAVKKEIRWLAYYKIKNLNPLIFSKGYGPLSITRLKEGIKISFNLTNYTNPYLYIELVSDKQIMVSNFENVSVQTFNDYYFHDVKIWYNNSKTGYIFLNYTYINTPIGKEYNYPNIILIKKLECQPLEICENSGFLEGKLRVPLVKWFGMYQYKGILDKIQANEIIYNCFLKTVVSTYLIETHLFVWE